MQEWGSERSEVEGTAEGIRMVRWGAVAVARGVVGGGGTRFVLDNPMRRSREVCSRGRWGWAGVCEGGGGIEDGGGCGGGGTAAPWVRRGGGRGATAAPPSRQPRNGTEG